MCSKPKASPALHADPTTDLDLLDRWRAGDRRAGEELFSRHFAEVFRFFEGKVGAVGDKAEDLTQQTFFECTRSRDRFRGESSFRTYLFGIAWNELRQHIRRGLKGAAMDLDVTSLDDLAAAGSSPSSRIDRARRGEQIRRALAALPLSQQVLLEYHYWHGLDAAALAQVFGATAATVRVRLARARALLREQLARARQGSAEGDSVDPMAAFLRGGGATGRVVHGDEAR